MQRRNLMWIAWLALLATAAGARADGRANESLVCRADLPQQDKYSYLRSLSLDLRGVTPTQEEYAALDGVDDVPESTINEFLQSEEFVQRSVRWHREMLWNNVSNISLTSFRQGMTRAGSGVWYRADAATLYRGIRGTECLDQPVEHEPDGSIRTYAQADTTRREGYVMVRPYWAPTTEIKVCALDAQDALVSSSGVDCGTRAGNVDLECGCGPELRWCRQGDGNTRITRAIAQDLERRVAALVRENRPYSELFTSRRAFVNGPMVHFWKYQTGHFDQLRFDPLPLDLARLPDLAFTDEDTWVEIELPLGHAGILTSTAFLLRFQTNRSRANQVFNAFLCQPFQPPSGGVPPGSPEEQKKMDLQERAGCKYCHTILEPSAAYWGRWPERGVGYLEPTRFPLLRQDCLQCARTGQGCTEECRRFYLTRMLGEEQIPYLGMLNAMEYRRDDHVRNVERGPELLAEGAVVDNRLPGCTASRMGERLLGRELAQDEERWAQQELARSFVQSHYSYRELVKRVVQSPVYRRVR